MEPQLSSIGVCLLGLGTWAQGLAVITVRSQASGLTCLTAHTNTDTPNTTLPYYGTYMNQKSVAECDG